MVTVGAREMEERPAPLWIDRVKTTSPGSGTMASGEADTEMRRLACEASGFANRRDFNTAIETGTSSVRRVRNHR